MAMEENNQKTVRDVTLQLLRDLGLTTIFGNPSHTEMKLFESWPDDIRFVMGLQEASVVAMADGYAQATGKPSLVMINGGPGLGNAMGSVYTAASAHTPMVILGGQQARKMLLGEPFLKARDATLLPAPYIKWSAEPARPQDVPELLAKAYNIAAQPPHGPVFLAVPEDDWVRPAAPVQLPHTVRGAVVPDQAALAELADILNAAERPGLVAGPVVDKQGARRDLVALAEKLGAQVWGSPVWPRSSFPETHPLFAGVLPPIPEMISERLSRHDVVVIFGSPAFTLFTTSDLFSTQAADLDTSSVWNLSGETRFLHVTDDPEAAAWSMAEISLVCPPGPAVAGLIPLVDKKEEQSQTIPGRPAYAVPSPSEPITQAYLFHLLAQELPEDAVLFEELPIARADFHEQIPLGPSNGYYATASGALGFPFAGAVGYGLARPDQRVVAVTGEGSAQYTLHSLWTAAQHNVPVTYVIPNNSGYLSLKYYLEDQQAWRSGWDLSGVNMATLAQGFGCPAERVESPGELQKAIRNALSADGPMLLDVVVADPGLFRL